MRFEKMADGANLLCVTNRSKPSLDVVLATRDETHRVTEPETRFLIDAITALIRDQ